jgi:GT2 family glycosyltransferase
MPATERSYSAAEGRVSCTALAWPRLPTGRTIVVSGRNADILGRKLMQVVLIIVTYGRKAVLSRLLAHLEKQTRSPDQVIVSAPDEGHVEIYRPRQYALSYVFGAHGCTAQRNKALDVAELTGAETVVFIDDDFIPADDYIELAEAGLRDNPKWFVLTGRVVFDDVCGPGLSFEEGLAKLEASAGPIAVRGEPAFSHRHGAYGCNMVMRGSDIGAMRFDERLPLYGWQEDTDFSRRLAGSKGIVQLNALRGVHLGIKRGRISGVRFGYSQIANPIYLVRKGTMPARSAARLMTKNVTANLIGSARPEPHIDRLGRLKGNILAAYHILRGRIEPEFILKL